MDAASPGIRLSVTMKLQRLIVPLILASLSILMVGVVVPALAQQEFIRGDANGDGSVSVTDAVYLAQYLFAKGPLPQPTVDSGDANCSGRVNMIDAIYLINYTLRGGPEPRCPTL